ncbi:hypothetical protein C9374_010603 [Naegleria lovaniensis]|uniref:glycine--tRNA ligase n=1 Tax=Naegleria lovaniensis TaxID=51637 RepID=A0AA88KFJ6_NAELO|nr:uncharacterized protein C9374_010603 [Naegleria lovaniensis]KAG2374584.1 hypothetical protein C9374_010603 [Naegleria lovaniensis]
MFPISIHNKGSTNQKVKNYLRKDLKQNIYCNFNRLLQVNRNKLPFAAAQIGQVFRNEIYPKSVLRVREFTSTEIICFFNPNRDMHPRMDQVKHVMVPLLTRENQTMSLPPMDFSIEDVLNQQFVNSPIQAYYIAKVKLFMDLCGVLPNAIRFRQHLSHEMSFSTTDHWSCELKSSLGWIEVVDIVNNYCYDLKCHSSQSRHVLVAFETFDQPLTSENIVMEVEHEKLGKILRKNKRVVLNFLETLTNNKKLELQQELESNGKFSIYIPQLDRQVELSSDFISFQKRITKIYGYKYEPCAVETTFHIGRLIYSLLEQCFWVRKGNYLHEKMSQKYVLSLPTIIAPYMVVLISQISNRASSFEGMSKTLTQLFTRNGITFRVDNSANQTIGKKYSRADEIGVPFAVTIDNQSVECNTVTIRERDSCDQVRLPLDELVPTLLDLIHGNKSWEEVSLK